MKKVEVLADNDPTKFQRDLQRCLDEGYELLNTYCGILYEPDSYSRTFYQAILLKTV